MAKGSWISPSCTPVPLDGYKEVYRFPMGCTWTGKEMLQSHTIPSKQLLCTAQHRQPSSHTRSPPKFTRASYGCRDP